VFHQNNFVGTLKIMSNVAKNFHIPTTSLNVLHNYFDKIIFLRKPFFLCAKIILLDHQNNYEERNSSMSNTVKSFDIVASLSIT